MSKTTARLSSLLVVPLLLVLAGTSGALVAPAGHDATMLRLIRSLGAQTAPAAEGGERSVPRARCGHGSAPETGLQGEVPAADVTSGRATHPYTCNLQQLNAPLGEGAGLQAAYYKSCAYYAVLGTGVRVVDVTNRAHPRITTTLTSPAMLDPWESLKVTEKRGLLAAVEGTVSGPLFFDVYDVSKDCTKPVLKSSMPMNTLGHEGNWSQDGTIYYATSVGVNLLTAIDVKDPAAPSIITIVPLPVTTGHGLSTNAAGTRLYTVDSGVGGRTGVLIYDVSAIKARQLGAQPTLLSSLRWSDGAFSQHTIPVIAHGHPYLIEADEHSYGGARVIDIADDTKPATVSHIRTEIQLSQNATRRSETKPDTQGGFGYNFHYCNVDRLIDPTALACSSRASGVRVFDIRNLLKPKEIAYLNPVGEFTAQVRLDAARGELWTTDGTHGLIIAKFTNGAWPFRSR